LINRKEEGRNCAIGILVRWSIIMEGGESGGKGGRGGPAWGGRTAVMLPAVWGERWEGRGRRSSTQGASGVGGKKFGGRRGCTELWNEREKKGKEKNNDVAAFSAWWEGKKSGKR